MGKKKKGNKLVHQVERALHENDELALQRIGIEQGKTRTKALGIHEVHTSKMKSPKWGITPHVTVERVHTFQADISSNAWKRYMAKEITFQQFKSMGRIS